ncbi:MAG: hypothetical protein LBF16_06410 [Pseudomonadales bacterium]|jgi:HemY protein|nr:hypothetical protein [Pseudomonadales bacterium]
MKSLFISVLVALVIGAGAAFLLDIDPDPGYILVDSHGWTMQATPMAVALGFVAVCLLLVAAIWLLRIINPLKLLFTTQRDAEAATATGLEHLLLGRWQEGYRCLVEYAEKVNNPVVNYLGGAIAAHERGDMLGRNFCLDRAAKRADGDDQGIRALRAWFDTRDGDIKKGLTLFLDLKRQIPEDPFILRNIKDCYLKLSDWKGLHELLPLLEKHKLVAAEELHAMRLRVERQRLMQASAQSTQALQLAWQQVPKPLKTEHELVGFYLKCLVQRGDDMDAGAQIRLQLKQRWDDDLVALLGHAQDTNPKQLLLFLEEQMKARPHNPILLLTLGRVSLRNQLWDKARDYFEMALRLSASDAMTAEISAELARLLERLGQTEQSLAHYHSAMQLLLKQLPPLPLPEQQAQQRLQQLPLEGQPLPEQAPAQQLSQLPEQPSDQGAPPDQGTPQASV